MKRPKIHFIGIGGIGVSALARYFLAQNWLVSGSDVAKSQEVVEIQRQGIKVKIGHKKSNIRPDLDLVVYSQAVPFDNPEVLEARHFDIPLKSYPEALGELTRRYETIAIAGSHGKSTTTALTALVFIEAGLDPTVIIGTKLKEFGGQSRLPAGGNFRLGKGKYLIIEADEYKDSFLNYHPQAVVVTNVDREHLDHYKNFAGVKKGFLKFMGNLRPRGVLVLNKDDKPLASLAGKIMDKKIIWFSMKDVKQVKQIKKVLRIPGAHNISNALAVFKLARSFGVKGKVILKAFSKYNGAWRRMEYKGELRIQNLEYRSRKTKKSPSILNSQFSILVYDDYAHHPTEIKATLRAFKEKYPKSLLICVFQPHQSRRLKILFKEFTAAFDKTDVLVLLDIYKVSGRDELSHNINSKELAKVINRRRNKPKKVIYLASRRSGLPYPKELKATLLETIKNYQHKSAYYPYKSVVIVMMGAGNIVNLTPGLLK